MNDLFVKLSLILGLVSQIFATEIHYCNATLACPEKYPCCSQSGVCGTGPYCLNNCDPRYSFDLESCMPVPICKNYNTRFSNYSSKIANADTFLGNITDVDWTYSGYIMDYEDDDALILAMPKNSGGTVLASTHAVWYGKISATLKTSHLAGVVTSFILYSGVQDEIDFEWIGTDLNTIQTNFYWNGVLNWTNSINMSTTDTYNNYHTYEIDWQEDYLSWSVDGVVGRTLYKNATYNETSGIYAYPQTPSKVDISIWPGGNATNAQGTIEWAGGEINWDAPDIKDPGYYYAIVKEVNITCNDIPSGTKQNGTVSYIYDNEDEFLSKDIAVVDKRVYLGSFDASGTDPDAGVVKSSSSSSSSKKTSSSSSSSSSSSKKGKGKKTTATGVSSSSSNTHESSSKLSSIKTTSITYAPAISPVSTRIEVTYVTKAISHNGTTSSGGINTKTESGNNAAVGIKNMNNSPMLLIVSLFLLSFF